MISQVCDKIEYYMAWNINGYVITPPSIFKCIPPRKTHLIMQYNTETKCKRTLRF